MSQQSQVKEMLTSSSVDEITKVYVQQNSDITKAEVIHFLSILTL